MKPTLDPDPHERSPLAIADLVRHCLRVQSPSRFGGVEVRVTNGEVAVTGSVPTDEARSYALGIVQAEFRNLRVRDALEVRNRRSFSLKPLGL